MHSIGWLLGKHPHPKYLCLFLLFSSPNWRECLNNKLHPQGRAGSCLCGDELAFNKAHVHCWEGALSMGRVWESCERQSHSSVWLASSTPPAPDYSPRGVGTLHLFSPYSLFFFYNSFTVRLPVVPTLQLLPTSFPLCLSRHHFILSLFINLIGGCQTAWALSPIQWGL